MGMQEVITIEVTAQYKDKLTKGIGIAKNKVDKFEESLKKLQKQADKLVKTTRAQIDMIDRASDSIRRIQSKAMAFAKGDYLPVVGVLDRATASIERIGNFAKALELREYNITVGMNPLPDLNNIITKKIGEVMINLGINSSNPVTGEKGQESSNFFSRITGFFNEIAPMVEVMDIIGTKVFKGGRAAANAAGAAANVAGNTTNAAGTAGRIWLTENTFRTVPPATTNVQGAASAVSRERLAATSALPVAGAMIAGTALADAGSDIVDGFNAEDKNDKKRAFTRGGVKVGAVAAGALIGSVIPGVGTLVGAGVGGLVSIFAGNTIADNISGIKKSSKELAEEMEVLKNENLAKHFGEVSLSAKQVSESVNNIIGQVTMDKANKFIKVLNNLKAAEESVGQSDYDYDFANWNMVQKGGDKKQKSLEFAKAGENKFDDANKYILNKKYSAEESTKLLLSGKDNKKARRKALKGIDEDYGASLSDIKRIKKEYLELKDKALKDDIITKPEKVKMNKKIKELKTIKKKHDKKPEEKNETENKFNEDINDAKKESGEKGLSYPSYIEHLTKLRESGDSVIKVYDDALDQGLNDPAIKDKEPLKKGYSKEAGEVNEKIVNWQMNEIEKTYGADKGSFKENMTKFVGSTSNKLLYRYRNFPIEAKEKEIEKQIKATSDHLTENLDEATGVTKDQSQAAKDVADSFQPEKEKLLKQRNEFENNNKEVPDWILNTLNEMKWYEALGGDEKAIRDIFEGGMKDLGNFQNNGDGVINDKETAKPTPAPPPAPTTTAQPTAESVQDTGIKVDESLGAEITKHEYIYKIPVDIEPIFNIKGFNLFGKSFGPSQTGEEKGTKEKSGKSGRKSEPKPKNNADGNFIHSKTLSWVGEDGPEVIIPLGNKRRKRGIDLWERAGEALGIGKYADGGFAGAGSSGMGTGSKFTPSKKGKKAAESASKKGDTTVNLGGVTIEINQSGDGSKQGIVESIKAHKQEIADTVCGIISDALEEDFENMPLAAE